MKRRNFLSGLLAAPLALKTRLARFVERKPVQVCNAPIGRVELRRQPVPSSGVDVLALMRGQSIPTRLVPVFMGLAALCTLPRGHKGPHVCSIRVRRRT